MKQSFLQQFFATKEKEEWEHPQYLQRPLTDFYPKVKREEYLKVLPQMIKKEEISGGQEPKYVPRGPGRPKKKEKVAPNPILQVI